MSDPLAALEELVAEWEREGQIMARRLIAAPELRAAIAKTREALGEVEVREEWAIQYADGDLDGGYDCREGVEMDIAGLEPDDLAAPAHRTVTNTKHVTPGLPWRKHE